MRVVRYILQAIILLLGGVVLLALALSPQFEALSFLVAAVLFGVLFFFTLLLREQTESRIVIGREVNPKIIATLIAMIGAGNVWLSASIVNGYTGSSSRRGDWLRLAIEILGPWPPALAFLALGLFFLRLGYGAFRKT